MNLLIIEDSLRLARLFQQGLVEEGYCVDIAVEGRKGLAMASGGAYDLVLLDINLPNLNGFDLIHQLRERRGDVPVIMVTARDDLHDRIKGLDYGADDYMVKPVIFEELLARIRAVARRAATREGQELVCGDVRLNSFDGKAWRGDELLTLSPKEFYLLRTFLLNKNKVLSRDELEKMAWGSEYDGLSNRLDVYINYLRSKLESGNRTRLIQTVRYQGYYFGDKDGPKSAL